MEKLPEDVKFDIFSRLPSESILEYKLVCKSWLSLFNNDHSFAQIHLRRQLCLLNNDDEDTPELGGGDGGGIEFGFILLVNPKFSDDVVLLYGKYDENDQHSYMIVKNINHPAFPLASTTPSGGGSTYSTIPNGLSMIGSCNGFICLSIPCPNDGDDVVGDPTYIFNPITREHLSLPRLLDDDTSVSMDCKIMSGFGYHPSTNEYKVVRILYSNDDKKKLGQVQVYTLGVGSGWRDKGEVALSFWLLFGESGTHSNGKLHWLFGDGEIVAFDLADEEFHLIPAPPIVYLDDEGEVFQNYTRRLCVLGGWLGLAHHVLSEMGENSHVDIWLLKKKSTSGYDMNKQEHECWDWSKQFTIPIELVNEYYVITLLALTKRGEVLFLDFKDSLCLYDPKSARIENLIELEDDYVCHSATPHINSFVSLKALGENSNRRITGEICKISYWP